MELIKPLLFVVEKRVANVPDVSAILGRWTLLVEDSDSTTAGGTLDNHCLWDQLLKQYVHTDRTIGSISNCNAVDYEGLAKDPSFSEYLQQLATVDLAMLSRNEQLALWLNAYNALCIHLIIQKGNILLRSINELSTPDEKVWDQVAGTVAGVQVSLNQLEHERLRGQWDLPAIHACIVCASASCPNLRPEAFVASRLAEQMEAQVIEWLGHPTKGLALQQQNNQQLLWLSRIFLWFGSDFGNESATLTGLFSSNDSQFRAWLSQYIKDSELADRITTGTEGIRYFDYDWTLNRWNELS
jgi:hypothetical protein